MKGVIAITIILSLIQMITYAQGLAVSFMSNLSDTYLGHTGMV